MGDEVEGNAGDGWGGSDPIAVGHLGEGAPEGASWLAWIGFNLMIAVMLYFDIIANQDETTTVRQAAISSAMWVSVAFLFAGECYIFLSVRAEEGVTTSTSYIRQRAVVLRVAPLPPLPLLPSSSPTFSSVSLPPFPPRPVSTISKHTTT